MLKDQQLDAAAIFLPNGKNNNNIIHFLSATGMSMARLNSCMDDADKTWKLNSAGIWLYMPRWITRGAS